MSTFIWTAILCTCDTFASEINTLYVLLHGSVDYIEIDIGLCYNKYFYNINDCICQCIMLCKYLSYVVDETWLHCLRYWMSHWKYPCV